MLFSIIIPLCARYSEFWEDCLSSVFTQTEHDFECILVISKEEIGFAKTALSSILLKNRKNYKFVESDYSDQSNNRNIGILKAAGEYIVFLDNDDMLIAESLSAYRKMIDKYPSDLYICGMTRDHADCRSPLKELDTQTPPRILMEQDIVKLFFSGLSFPLNPIEPSVVLDSACGKAFKKDLLLTNHVFFESKSYSAEDALFVRDYAKCCKTAVYSPRLLTYFWRRNPSSVMHTFSGFFDINIFAEHLCKVTLRDIVLNGQPINPTNYLTLLCESRIDAIIAFVIRNEISVKTGINFIAKAYGKKAYIRACIDLCKFQSRSAYLLLSSHTKIGLFVLLCIIKLRNRRRFCAR